MKVNLSAPAWRTLPHAIVALMLVLLLLFVLAASAQARDNKGSKSKLDVYEMCNISNTDANGVVPCNASEWLWFSPYTQAPQTCMWHRIRVDLPAYSEWTIDFAQQTADKILFEYIIPPDGASDDWTSGCTLDKFEISGEDVDIMMLSPPPPGSSCRSPDGCVCSSNGSVPIMDGFAGTGLNKLMGQLSQTWFDDAAKVHWQSLTELVNASRKVSRRVCRPTQTYLFVRSNCMLANTDYINLGLHWKLRVYNTTNSTTAHRDLHDYCVSGQTSGLRAINKNLLLGLTLIAAGMAVLILLLQLGGMLYSTIRAALQKRQQAAAAAATAAATSDKDADAVAKDVEAVKDQNKGSLMDAINDKAVRIMHKQRVPPWLQLIRDLLRVDDSSGRHRWFTALLTSCAGLYVIALLFEAATKAPSAYQRFESTSLTGAVQQFTTGIGLSTGNLASYMQWLPKLARLLLTILQCMVWGAMVYLAMLPDFSTRASRGMYTWKCVVSAVAILVIDTGVSLFVANTITMVVQGQLKGDTLAPMFLNISVAVLCVATNVMAVWVYCHPPTQQEQAPTKKLADRTVTMESDKVVQKAAEPGAVDGADKEGSGGESNKQPNQFKQLMQKAGDFVKTLPSYVSEEPGRFEYTPWFLAPLIITLILLVYFYMRAVSIYQEVWACLDVKPSCAAWGGYGYTVVPLLSSMFQPLLTQQPNPITFLQRMLSSLATSSLDRVLHGIPTEGLLLDASFKDIYGDQGLAAIFRAGARTYILDQSGADNPCTNSQCYLLADIDFSELVVKQPDGPFGRISNITGNVSIDPVLYFPKEYYNSSTPIKPDNVSLFDKDPFWQRWMIPSGADVWTIRWQPGKVFNRLFNVLQPDGEPLPVKWNVTVEIQEEDLLVNGWSYTTNRAVNGLIDDGISCNMTNMEEYFRKQAQVVYDNFTLGSGSADSQALDLLGNVLASDPVETVTDILMLSVEQELVGLCGDVVDLVLSTKQEMRQLFNRVRNATNNASATAGKRLDQYYKVQKEVTDFYHWMKKAFSVAFILGSVLAWLVSLSSMAVILITYKRSVIQLSKELKAARLLGLQMEHVKSLQDQADAALKAEETKGTVQEKAILVPAKAGTPPAAANGEAAAGSGGPAHAGSETAGRYRTLHDDQQVGSAPSQPVVPPSAARSRWAAAAAKAKASVPQEQQPQAGGQQGAAGTAAASTTAAVARKSLVDFSALVQQTVTTQREASDQAALKVFVLVEATKEQALYAAVFFYAFVFSIAMVQLIMCTVLFTLAFTALLHPFFWKYTIGLIVALALSLLLSWLVLQFIIMGIIGGAIAPGGQIKDKSAWMLFFIVMSFANLVLGWLLAIIRIVLILVSGIVMSCRIDMCLVLLAQRLDGAYGAYLAMMKMQGQLNLVSEELSEEEVQQLMQDAEQQRQLARQITPAAQRARQLARQVTAAGSGQGVAAGSSSGSK